MRINNLKIAYKAYKRRSDKKHEQEGSFDRDFESFNKIIKKNKLDIEEFYCKGFSIERYIDLFDLFLYKLDKLEIELDKIKEILSLKNSNSEFLQSNALSILIYIKSLNDNVLFEIIKQSLLNKRLDGTFFSLSETFYINHFLKRLGIYPQKKELILALFENRNDNYFSEKDFKYIYLISLRLKKDSKSDYDSILKLLSKKTDGTYYSLADIYFVYCRIEYKEETITEVIKFLK